MGLPASLALHQAREAFGGVEEEVLIGNHAAETQELLSREKGRLSLGIEVMALAMGMAVNSECESNNNVNHNNKR